MEKYRPIKQLGEGTYGVVYKAVNEETQDIVAIKQMKQKISWDEATKLAEVKAL